MANIQVKNVPEELHRRLRRSARKRRATLREVVLGAIERQLSHEEFISACGAGRRSISSDPRRSSSARRAPSASERGTGRRRL